MGFKLDYMQGLYFTPRKLFLMNFAIVYSQFFCKSPSVKKKIAFSVADKHLVGEVFS